MAELRKLGVLSVAKINAVLSAFMGFLIGIFYAILGALFAAGGTPIIPGIPAFLLGFGFVIVFPVFYGIIGFVSGAIFAALYNFFVPLVGGIEMKFRMNK